MNHTPVFLMPVKLSGSERELRHFREAVDSIKAQTDPDWKLVMIDDYSDSQKVYDLIDVFKSELGDKIHVIYSDKNYGSGEARNKGVRYAAEIGAPFIVFLDTDDLADPRRLELVRAAFEKDDSVNVVYTSFIVIDENGNPVPEENISMSIREITDGHTRDIVEGENAWIAIATKKKYTNLTSCTAVRTSLAIQELFPTTSVSEDCHTWFRYGAHPGKFVFLREIKGCYRICTGTASRSRSLNHDFYEKMFKTDSDGFEKAMELAKKYGTMGGMDENDLRVGFYVRLTLSLLHGNADIYAKTVLAKAIAISKEKTLEYVDRLFCLPEYKERIKAMVNEN